MKIVDILKENENVRIERIISTGQVSDWMIQERKEYDCPDFKVMQLLNLTIRKLQMKAGDTLFIEKQERHRVSYTSENPCCIWFCIHFLNVILHLVTIFKKYKK